jgi:hypothetical protein
MYYKICLFHFDQSSVQNLAAHLANLAKLSIVTAPRDNQCYKTARWEIVAKRSITIPASVNLSQTQQMVCGISCCYATCWHVGELLQFDHKNFLLIRISQGCILPYNKCVCRSQISRVQRRGTVAVSLLGLRARIPPATWTSVLSFVLSGRGLCEELITRPESYRVSCVWVWK